MQLVFSQAEDAVVTLIKETQKNYFLVAMVPLEKLI